MFVYIIYVFFKIKKSSITYFYIGYFQFLECLFFIIELGILTFFILFPFSEGESF